MTTADKVLCISDLHLSPERPDISRAFGSFLQNRARKARALYILGDLFDVWIGDDNVTDQSVRVGEWLRNLSSRGTDVFFMHGNRDFLLGEKYAGQCNAALIHEPHTLTFHGRNYLLIHGDSLCTRDEDYMAFRRMVRSGDWQRNFLSLPVEERAAFAGKARAQSKTMTGTKPEDIMDVTPDEVTKLLTRHRREILVHGHTHRPAVHPVPLGDVTGTRIVLGDWAKKGWYLEIGPEGHELISFPIQA